MFVVLLILVSISNGFNNIYRYDANGNLVNDGKGNSYLYNSNNQLIEFDQNYPQIKNRFHYDAEGLLDNSQNLQDTYHFIYRKGLLSNLILKGQKIINTLQKDVIFMSRNGYDMSYYRAAIHNNTQSLLLSQNSNLLDDNNFAPFGAKRLLKQNSINPSYDLAIVKSLFAYDGEHQDPLSQLIYLHARFYNPKLMRFVQRDGYDLLNRYSFTNDDPVNKIDPSGHNAIASFFHGLADGMVSGMSIGFCTTAGCSTNNYKQLLSGNKSAWIEFFNPIAVMVPLIQQGGSTDAWAHAIGMSLPNTVIIGRDVMTGYYGSRVRRILLDDYEYSKNASKEGASLGRNVSTHYNWLSARLVLRNVITRRDAFNYLLDPVYFFKYALNNDYHFTFKGGSDGFGAYYFERMKPWNIDMLRKTIKFNDSKFNLKMMWTRILEYTDASLYSINTNSLNQYNRIVDINQESVQ